MTETTRAYVGLGSNLNNPIKQIKQALSTLKITTNIELTTHSSLYQSTPMGPQNQPNYINAVATLETTLDALSLLTHLQNIENQQGRVRYGDRWGPRTLDLDLLLYGKTQQESARLTLPHPGLHLRNFVLIPLNEIAPDLIIPGLGKLQKIMNNIQGDDLQVLEKVA